MIITLNMLLEKAELPNDYSPAFVSLIKNALSKYDNRLFDKVYLKRAEKEKNFCFALKLDRPKFGSGVILLDSVNVQMKLSISDPMDGIDFYNAFLMQKDKPYPMPNGNEITVKRVKLEEHRHIKSSVVLIKMMSPLIVRQHENGINRYLSYDDENFIRCFKLSVSKMFESFGMSCGDNEIEIEPIKAKKTVVNTFGNKITGNIGVFKLRARPEILNELYKLGVGSRRSQGFGMFEIVAEVM